MLLLSDDLRLWLGLPLLLGALWQTGCADARGRFEDYQRRLRAVDAGSVSDAGDADADAACTPPAPGTVSGPALLAVDTNLAAGRPILFLGVIDTPALDGTTAVRFVYRALDSQDRATRVGDELQVGPYALLDGELVAPVALSTLEGDANPIIHGVPITSEMTLTGRICGVRRFYCGTLDGRTEGTISGPFTGKFGITLLEGPDAVPAQPRFGCDAGDVADALADAL